tara:strand:+ start:129 stop:1844 length:1716 start_codon:yes stop_codon:yes gene_type:complete
MKFTDIQEDGRIVKGVNTTADVGPNQTSIEANKLVGKVNKDGYPPELHSKARKNSKPNTLYNLGLAEQFLEDVYTPRKYLTQLEQACIEGGHELPENISNTGSKLRRGENKKRLRLGDPDWPELIDDVSKQENISHTGTATARRARKKNITPGDDDWFEHWFSLPYFMGKKKVSEWVCGKCNAEPCTCEPLNENPIVVGILRALASKGVKVGKDIVQGYLRNAPPGVQADQAADAIIKLGTGVGGMAQQYYQSRGKQDPPTDKPSTGQALKKNMTDLYKGMQLNQSEEQDWYNYYKRFRDSNDDVIPLMKKYGYDPYNRKDVSTFLNLNKDKFDFGKILRIPPWVARTVGAGIAKDVGIDKGELNRALKIRKDFEKNMPNLFKALSTNPQDVNFEDVTPGELNALERVVDKAFAQVGIDVEFTRHFLDRANDTRNGEPITVQELARLFSKEIRRWGKPIAQMGPDTEAVMKDLESDINIPFALRWNGKELEMIAKTVMRKKDFRTSNKEFPVENFADGKKKGKSRPGRVKRSGASCKGSVTSLRAKAKKYSGERAKMYHWCANMKSGKKKK